MLAHLKDRFAAFGTLVPLMKAAPLSWSQAALDPRVWKREYHVPLHCVRHHGRMTLGKMEREDLDRLRRVAKCKERHTKRVLHVVAEARETFLGVYVPSVPESLR